MSRLILTPDRWQAELPKRCHWINKRAESQLRGKLREIGLAEVTPAEEVPRDSAGRLLSSGMLAVPHKVSSDRLIIGRRPMNAQETGYAGAPSRMALCLARFDCPLTRCSGPEATTSANTFSC
jgi:hypothetical protein